MKNPRALKIFFLSVLLGYASFAYTLPALAQTPSTPATPAATAPVKPEYSGVQGSIKDFLCTPTEQPKSQGTGAAGYNGATANNPASSDVFNCINKLYRFAIVAASVIGMFYVVAAGYLYMSADGSSESTGELKQYIGNVVAAFIILFAGNIILKAINPNLVNFYPVTPKVEFSKLPSSTPPTTTPGGTNPGGTNPSSPVNGTNTCLFSGVNVCKPVAWGKISSTGKFEEQPARGGECGAPSRCAQYSGSINTYAQQAGVDARILKAIIARESQCDISAGTAVSFGLMQLGLATANNTQFKSSCGVTATIDSSWLKNPANADKSICIASQYVSYLTMSTRCGSKPENIFAGYSAVDACSKSNDCASDTSCTGDSSVRKWECIYDDPAHTTCNGQPTFLGSTGGYNESRYAVMGKMYCYQNPGF